MAETHIFDSYALLKVFQKEEGYQKVVGLLRDVSASGGRALMRRSRG
jgi:hypothetical protein